MRSVVSLLASVFASSTAMAMLSIVLGKLVFDITGSELALGLLGPGGVRPGRCCSCSSPARSPTAWTAADWPRSPSASRRWCSPGSRCTWAPIPTSTLPIFLLVIGYGTARAFATPATRSLPADTVDGARLPWLTARQAATWQGALVLGPVLGGFLYVVGPWVPFAAAVVLVDRSRPTVLTVRVRPFVRPPAALPTPTAPRSSGMHEAMEGLRFVRSRPILLGAISLDLFAVLFGGAVALLPAIAEDRLGVGAVGLGWLRAATGIGAGVVALFLTWKPVSRHIGRVLLGCVALFGVGTIVLGATTSFAVAFVALLVLSGADAVSVFIRSTLVPLVTPADKRGRVLAVEAVFIGASNELGAFESGVVGQLLGPATAIVLGGVATLAVAAIWWGWFPDLRNVDTFPTGRRPGGDA